MRLNLWFPCIIQRVSRFLIWEESADFSREINFSDFHISDPSLFHQYFFFIATLLVSREKARTTFSGLSRLVMSFHSNTAILIPYGAVRVVRILVFLRVLIICIIVRPVWFRRSVRC